MTWGVIDGDVYISHSLWGDESRGQDETSAAAKGMTLRLPASGGRNTCPLSSSPWPRLFLGTNQANVFSPDIVVMSWLLRCHWRFCQLDVSLRRKNVTSSWATTWNLVVVDDTAFLDFSKLHAIPEMFSGLGKLEACHIDDDIQRHGSRILIARNRQERDYSSSRCLPTSHSNPHG